MAGAVLAAGRWRLRPVDGLGRARPFPVVSVTLLLVTALGALVPAVLHHRLEARLGEVASVLVGSPVTVDCQSRGAELVDVGAELGWVRYDAAGVPEPHTLIKRAPCSRLADYVRDADERRAPQTDTVVAVHVLAHEAAHMSGLTVEAQAECAAVQRDARTARLLGATTEQATALARRYWLEVYPRMRGEYRSPSCTAGGPWDERLPDAPWALPAR